MDATLLVGSAAQLAAAVLFAFTGGAIARRRVSTGARLPQSALMTWWMSIAVLWLIDAARGIAVAFWGATNALVRDTFVALFYVSVLLLCLALWGLLTYLVFLYQGRHAALPLAAFYGLYFLVASITVAFARPEGVRVGTWSTHIVYETPLPFALEASLFLFLLVPQLVGAGAYLSLASRTSDSLQRFRVIVVGSTLLVWIGVNLVADLAQLTYDDTWQIVRVALGVVASAAILGAYAPPAWIRRRVGRAVEVGA